MDKDTNRHGKFSVIRFGAPMVSLLLISFGLSASSEIESGTAIAIASCIASFIAMILSRKLAIPLLLLAVLSWSAQKSHLDPMLVYSNRERASDYIFGRDLSEDEYERIYAQAERTTMLSLKSDAQRLVYKEHNIEKNAVVSADVLSELQDEIDERSSQMRETLTQEEWDGRIHRAAKRAEQDRRGGFFPIEKDTQSLMMYFDAIFETVAIAIWGTLIAFLVAFPISLFASKRTLSIMSSGTSLYHRIGRKLGAFMARRGFDACRGFNEFVLALIFVAVIGLGPFAGVLALAVHTFGVLGKVFADALDTIQEGEVEGVTASGASPVHVISFAVLPQVFPIVISQSLLRFESNVRSASVLGLVGAGGIGFLIDAKLKAYQFQEVATIMLIIIVLVSLIDFGCSWIVKRFV